MTGTSILQGYGELAQLEQPLVAGDGSAETTNDNYLRQHGVSRPGGAATQAAAAQGAVPSQVRENIQTSSITYQSDVQAPLLRL